MASKNDNDKSPEVPDDETLVIPPEDELKELSREDLDALHERSVEAFRAVYGDGTGISPEDLETLNGLKAGIKAVEGVQAERKAVEEETAEKAAKIAADLNLSPEEPAPEDDDDEDGDSDEADDAAVNDEAEVIEEAEQIAASASKEIRVNLAGRARKPVPVPAETGGERSMKDIAFSPDGKGIDKYGIAKLVDEKLNRVNHKAYQTAARSQKKMSERFPIATIRREFSDELKVSDGNADAAINFAVDQSRLPGGSLLESAALTASGGWCAPSETSYDLCNLSEAANLISIPEVNINRGGLKWTTGPDYASVFADTGFCYTEEEDIDGDYDGAGGGVKPCLHVPCPDFEEKRLGYCGVCLTAGLLQQKGYPEAIQNFVDIALNAHAHRVSAAVINDMVAESTAVALDAGQAGATAPLLTALDLQATHYRAVNRMADTAVLEAVLPTWAKTIIRADLARRQGVDLLDVPDSRIAAWFTARRVNPQYVVDWQDISTTPASGYIATETSIDFLLFAAGTFVKGVTDSITFENIYDSVGLGTNDYTALFTEDPYMVMKRCHDSRVVTVPVCADGATKLGVNITCDGTV